MLITGGAGFLGKRLLKKLLRTCGDVRTVYVVVKSQKGKTLNNRIRDLFTDTRFNRLRGTQIHFANKVSIVNGDVSRPILGLAKYDYEALVNEVNCIFHCAASIYHEESLGTAAHTNVGGMKEVLELAERMKSLRGQLELNSIITSCSLSLNVFVFQVENRRTFLFLQVVNFFFAILTDSGMATHTRKRLTTWRKRNVL